jgi:hypothetical protein
MVTHQFDRTSDPFADGYGGYDNNELLESKELVQFKNSPKVYIGLPVPVSISMEKLGNL